VARAAQQAATQVLREEDKVGFAKRPLHFRVFLETKKTRLVLQHLVIQTSL
jgi:hypothetical protein